MTVELCETPIAELQRAMAAGETTAAELVAAYLARIEAYDENGPALNAVLFVNPDALGEAVALDREREQRGPRGPLHGIPLLVKDNVHVAGMPTRAGCRALDGLVAEEDAFVVERLRRAGAIILGKTNLHELAAGITSVGSMHGRVRNPYDVTRTPGGSSGGTAAAVAASFAAAGIATDTTGSIRIPAAYTACVGLRPTQGLVSRSGIVPLALSQDIPGPIARSVGDLAILLDAIVGPDPRDDQTHEVRGRSVAFRPALDPEALRGRRIGRLEPLFADADADIVGRIEEALGRAESAGAEIDSISCPELDALVDEQFVLVLSEVQGDLDAWLATQPTAPVRSLAEIIDSGMLHPEFPPVKAADLELLRGSPAYADACENRGRLRQVLDDLLRVHELDALAYPSMRQPPAVLGMEQLGNNANAAANAGLPAITVPAGFTADGLPVGLELLGRAFDDTRLLGFAYALEQSGCVRRPPPTTPELPPVAAVAPGVARVTDAETV